jgi:hypothetical protein
VTPDKRFPISEITLYGQESPGTARWRFPSRVPTFRGYVLFSIDLFDEYNHFKSNPLTLEEFRPFFLALDVFLLKDYIIVTSKVWGLPPFTDPQGGATALRGVEIQPASPPPPGPPLVSHPLADLGPRGINRRRGRGLRPEDFARGLLPHHRKDLARDHPEGGTGIFLQREKGVSL